MEPLYTARLELRPMTLAMVEAVLERDREAAERAAGARFPEAWPGTSLIERAFTVSLEAIREAPARRLWGNRLMLLPSPGDDAPLVVGSVVFHGAPEADGVAEVGYGVEESFQRQGFATEAVAACVTWALAHGGARAVRATTLPWHTPSIRVLEKVGMSRIGEADHETLGELVIYELRG